MPINTLTYWCQLLRTFPNISQFGELTWIDIAAASGGWYIYSIYNIYKYINTLYIYYIIYIYICGLSPNYGTLPTKKRTNLFALYTHFGISTWHCSLREKPVVLLFKDEEFPNLKSQIKFQRPQPAHASKIPTDFSHNFVEGSKGSKPFRWWMDMDLRCWIFGCLGYRFDPWMGTITRNRSMDGWFVTVNIGINIPVPWILWGMFMYLSKIVCCFYRFKKRMVW